MGFPAGSPPPDGAARPPCLVLSAQIDGTWAIWDALHVTEADPADAVLTFTREELWEGKEVRDANGRRQVLCEGLIQDWVAWLREQSPQAAALSRTLAALSAPGEPLSPGTPARVRLNDVRRIPTLSTAAGTIPVTLASAAVKRILSIAYLIVWAWTRHTELAVLTRRPPVRDIVLLLDEVELHLHPRWQRVILPALMSAIRSLTDEADVQIIATTHAPLILASLEPHFQPELDSLFTFDIEQQGDHRRIYVERAHWRRIGDVSSWLTSPVFDLKWARSREAEEAIQAAIGMLDRTEQTPEEMQQIEAALQQTLGDTDPFWTRWLRFRDQRNP